MKLQSTAKMSHDSLKVGATRPEHSFTMDTPFIHISVGFEQAIPRSSDLMNMNINVKYFVSESFSIGTVEFAEANFHQSCKLTLGPLAFERRRTSGRLFFSVKNIQKVYLSAKQDKDNFCKNQSRTALWIYYTCSNFILFHTTVV